MKLWEEKENLNLVFFEGYKDVKEVRDICKYVGS